MTANPFLRPDKNPPRGGPDQLHEHVTKLNNYRWVQASGKLFYVGSRQRADGTIEHFVDRHI